MSVAMSSAGDALHNSRTPRVMQSIPSLPVSAAMPILGNLSHMLTKAQVFVEIKKCDPGALTNDQMAPDMLPFTRQILIACDVVKNGVARISGVQAPKFDDQETRLAELQLRVAKTLDFLKTIPAARLDGMEDKEITFPVGLEATRTLKENAYLKDWMLPNMYFHVTMAYAILRHNGVELGKSDYLFGAAT